MRTSMNDEIVSRSVPNRPEMNDIMKREWESMKKMVDAGNDPLGLTHALEKARPLMNVDPQEAAHILSLAAGDIKDAMLPIDAFTYNLGEKVPVWALESTQRLIDATEQYFCSELERIEGALENNVGYGTQFIEMKESISSQLSQWSDKRKLKKSVKEFFRQSENDPELKKERAKWCNLRDYASKFEEYIKGKYPVVNDDIRSEEKLHVRDEISRIEKIGLKRYEKLEKTGFFEADPTAQKDKLLKFDRVLLEEFIKRGWIATEPQMKFGAGLVGTLLEQSFGDDALNNFRDEFFSEENRRFESFWKAEVAEASQHFPGFSLVLSGFSGDVVEANISAEAATAVLVAAAPLAAAGVLAAGWHTMAWAMSNLFPPMLLVSIPIAVAAIVKGKESTSSSMKREARNFCDRMLSSQKLSIKANYRNQCERAARQFVENFRINALAGAVGLSSKRSVYNLLECIDKICSSMVLEIAPSRVNFLDLCYENLESGNGYSAAALSVQAYEACIDNWLEKMSLPNPKPIDFLRRSIKLLRQHPDVPRHVPDHLDSLRRVRNRWAHGMRDLVDLPERERKRRVAEVLDRLQSVMPKT